MWQLTKPHRSVLAERIYSKESLMCDEYQGRNTAANVKKNKACLCSKYSSFLVRTPGESDIIPRWQCDGLREGWEGGAALLTEHMVAGRLRERSCCSETFNGADESVESPRVTLLLFSFFFSFFSGLLSSCVSLSSLSLSFNVSLPSPPINLSGLPCWGRFWQIH